MTTDAMFVTFCYPFSVLTKNEQLVISKGFGDVTPFKTLAVLSGLVSFPTPNDSMHCYGCIRSKDAMKFWRNKKIYSQVKDEINFMNDHRLIEFVAHRTETLAIFAAIKEKTHKKRMLIVGTVDFPIKPV